MEDPSEPTFRKLIQRAGTDKTSADFTRNVMKKVRAETEREQAGEAALRALLQDQRPVDTPSAGFSRHVMAQVQALPRQREEPIIGKPIWYLVGAALLLICLVSLSIDSPTDEPHTSPVSRFLAEIMDYINTLPVIYPLTILSISALLLLDYFLRQRMNKAA